MEPSEKPSTYQPSPLKFTRRQWVVYPYLQYRLIFIWAAFMLGIFFVLFLTMSKIFSSMLDYVRYATHNNQDLMMYLEQQTRTLEIYIILGFLLFVVIFIYYQLTESNRIAGPIFNLRRKMRLSCEQGKLEKVSFRKNDYFVELATDYNALVEKFQAPEENSPEENKTES